MDTCCCVASRRLQRCLVPALDSAEPGRSPSQQHALSVAAIRKQLSVMLNHVTVTVSPYLYVRKHLSSRELRGHRVHAQHVR